MQCVWARILVIHVDMQQTKMVKSWVYFGQEIIIGKNNQQVEFKRRMCLRRAVYSKLIHVLRSKLPSEYKTTVYNECILPVTTHDRETLIPIMKTLQTPNEPWEAKSWGEHSRGQNTK